MGCQFMQTPTTLNDLERKNAHSTTVNKKSNFQRSAYVSL